ncbi:MAG: phosphopentomutase [Kiritimatiellae bacterium]|nr:phosphopentomutase [Kiritimatiellia bacterium]MDW8458580.1 phosphopentomutase [Verrucomicrobiota bacterium]
MRIFLIVLDSVGIGHAPDAADYGDEGAATLPHIAEAIGGLSLPTFERLGLGNIPALTPRPVDIPGLRPSKQPLASFGAMQEMSQGKDTITGHWEIAGLLLRPGFTLFPPGPPSFPSDIIEPFERETGRKVLGNKSAGGTGIIDELGEQATREACWIVYTSADSVFQIAANIDVIPLGELYRACEIARRLCDPYRVGRVIARPFRRKNGSFYRTEDRRDYAYKPSEKTILERLQESGIPVYAVGKIEDIFAHRGISTSDHTGNNRASQRAVERFEREMNHGFLFANFIDFDMIFGHRRDPHGYAECLRQTDEWLATFIPKLGPDDTLIITADHGNDPTFKGTDHTREIVPLLVYSPGRPARSLGLRIGYYDVAQSIASAFGLQPMSRGVSFWS